MKKTGKTRLLFGILAAVMLLSVTVTAMALPGPKIIYYPDNTVCSFGPYFRYVTDPLTDKWYTFTPVDLAKDGAQTFMLIAGNKRIVGDVTVLVEGDAVTVSYAYKEDVRGKSEFFALFPDYDSIKTVEPGEITSGYTFGKALSIKNDLQGDTSMLLYVCNKATYMLTVSRPKFILPKEMNLETYYFTAYREERLQMAEMAGIADRYTEPELYVKRDVI